MLALATLVVVRLRSVPTHAAQKKVPACRAEGEVCTHLVGCCARLVCATSHINTNYGVCIPGDGDHLTVTDQLVVPAREGLTAELSVTLTDTEADAAAAAEIVATRADAAARLAQPQGREAGAAALEQHLEQQFTRSR